MGGWRGSTAVAAVILLGPVPVSLLAYPGPRHDHLGQRQGIFSRRQGSSASCRSSVHPALAARLARDIDRARHGRVSAVAVAGR